MFKRLIAVLTFNEGILFRTKRFSPDYRYTLNFVDMWDVDEIILLNITRGQDKKSDLFYRVVEIFAERCFVPLAVGGGVRSLDDFSTLLRLGADKVVVNSVAFDQPGVVESAAKRYGSQCVVGSVDALRSVEGEYEVFVNNGSTPTGIRAHTWAAHLRDLGAGEIMINSIDRDGSLQGYDNKLNLLISKTLNIPVLACGGAGNWEDFFVGFEKGGVSAVCTTNIFHFSSSSIAAAKNYLLEKGIQMRPVEMRVEK